MRLWTGFALPVGQFAQAGLTQHIWRDPDTVEQTPRLYRRQDGYSPEFGACGIGLTCAEACGNGFEACSAKETSLLFCYNPGAGQTCCPGGSGRACGAGFYCVTEPDGGQTYCCDKSVAVCTRSRSPKSCRADLYLVKCDKDCIGNNDSAIILVNNEELEVDNNLASHLHDRPSVLNDNRDRRLVSTDFGNHDSLDI
ncbi:hypothetical protein V8F20_011086 [Naviculisporaceae sp. PSN 640]